MTAVRVALALLPVRAIHRATGWLPVASPRGETARAADVARAVRRARSVVPGATCLVEALAGVALLERRGHAAQLRLGFAMAEEAGIRGHAWVESGGRVVLGGDVAGHAPAAGLGWDRA